MSKFACPYCYQRFALRDLHFQCIARAAPGRRRCPKKIDEERQRLTGSTAATGPTFAPPGRFRRPTRRNVPCPDCGNLTGFRACPVCHTPLPANFAEGRSPLIGMIGGKNAGKTVYTTVLVHKLRKEIARRFTADVSFAGEQAGADSTTRWLERYERALFDDYALFEATASAADGLQVPLVLQWRQQRRGLPGLPERYDTTTLSFYDAAGEDMTTQDFVNGQAYLTSSDGLIVLLDPFQLPGAADYITIPDAGRLDAEPPLHVLSRITALLRSDAGLSARKKIATPVAVVFSKIDAFHRMLGGDHPVFRLPESAARYDETAGQDTDEHLRALLTDLGADDIDVHLRSHYKNYRYFAVSSLGAEPDYGQGRIDPGGVRPHRVDEPLLWLLSTFRIIDRRTA